jgi:hypothetical protein
MQGGLLSGEKSWSAAFMRILPMEFQCSSVAKIRPQAHEVWCLPARPPISDEDSPRNIPLDSQSVESYTFTRPAKHIDGHAFATCWPVSTFPKFSRRAIRVMVQP